MVASALTAGRRKKGGDRWPGQPLRRLPQLPPRAARGDGICGDDGAATGALILPTMSGAPPSY